MRLNLTRDKVQQLRSVGIRSHDKIIHDQGRAWLQENFARGATKFPVNVSALVRNILWQTYDLAQRTTSKYSTKYSRKDFTQHQLITLNLIRIKCDWTYRQTIEWFRWMVPLRDHLDLDTMPDHTTLYHAFDHMSLTLGRLLLNESLEPFDLSGFTGIDATGFERSTNALYP